MNKKFLNSCYLIIALSFFVSCSSSNYESDGKPRPGKYNFSLTDSNEMKIAEGIFIMDSVTSSFTGTFEITKIMTTDYPSISKTTRDYEGGYNKTSKYYGFNLNPKTADANVYVAAVFSAGRFKGNWIYSTMMGIKGRGGFEAYRFE